MADSDKARDGCARGVDRAGALRHPVRRDILRRCHAHGRERGAPDLAAEMGLDLSTVAYHVRVLAAVDLLAASSPSAPPVVGTRRFRSTVEADGAVLGILVATEREDAEELRTRRSARGDAGR